MDQNLHHVWVCEELECATFPLWNLSGQLVGYQRYRPFKSKVPNNNPTEGRYFTRVKDSKVGVWGLESWNLSETLFVTERVFDACRLTYYGYSAIAVLSCDLSQTTRSWLSLVRARRKVVVVCDADPSGKKLAKYGHVSYTLPEGDLGDASEEMVMELCKKYG
jgi:hypothetical protein